MMRKILLLSFFCSVFCLAIAQTPKKSDFYYEKNDTLADSQRNLFKVKKISDGQHTFYSKNRRIITKGIFKNGKLIDGYEYFYNDRIVYYKDGIYKNYVHAEEISTPTNDSNVNRR